MSKTHNKKRSATFVHEALVRTIAQGLVEGNKKLSSKALKILKRRFKQGTELYKEFRLANSLLRTTVSSETVAGSIIQEAKRAARSHNASALEKEKSLLIHDINASLGASVFEQHVPDYTDRATVATLINDWRSDVSDIERLALYEDKLVKMLMVPKVQLQESFVSGDLVEDDFVMTLMSKKIDEKYGDVLSETQKRVMKSYVTEKETESTLRKVRDDLLREAITYDCEADVKEKMSKLQVKLTEASFEPTDENIEKFIEYAGLLDELKEGSN